MRLILSVLWNLAHVHDFDLSFQGELNFPAPTASVSPALHGPLFTACPLANALISLLPPVSSLNSIEKLQHSLEIQ